MNKRILYCGHGWGDNIGNAFIDMGINYSLKVAAPEDDIINISNVSNYIRYKYINKFPLRLLKKQTSNMGNFDLRTFFDYDYIVFGGSLLNINWLRINKSLIDCLIKSQKPVIILGGGGGNIYSEEQFTYVTQILKNLNIYAFISRDSITYDLYKDFADNAYDGIDNALFLNDTFYPVRPSVDNYSMYTFDFIKEPVNLANAEQLIIRTCHSYASIGRIEHIMRNPLKFIKTINNRQIISDYPDDYLHLYASATETYSDRVHACIATLIFGGKAKYFDKSDRSNLFQRIKIPEINRELVKLDFDYINKEKEKQLNFLKSIL